MELFLSLYYNCDYYLFQSPDVFSLKCQIHIFDVGVDKRVILKWI
jgi:hypothetical protein